MSLAYFIRSAARATSFAPRQIPIRWRLAGGSALLTLVILCGFAGAVGALTSQRIHADFDQQVSNAADRVAVKLHYTVTQLRSGDLSFSFSPALDSFDNEGNAVIRVVDARGTVAGHTAHTLNLGRPLRGATESQGYRIETRPLPVETSDVGNVFSLIVQYARPIADVEATVHRVQLFLVIGVLGGAGFALLAGLMIASSAMAPITALTATAREIATTRDTARRIPEVEADDEVSELARTLDQMLQALDAARSETEAALLRQREFVADASHELRTPLTSVLANLELLADHLDGEPREAARSALRSSQRMRRLVADLLLLARADAARQAPHAPTDMGQVLIDVAAELGAVSDGHELTIEPERAIVMGARDELHRLTLNLMENAIRHTPPGTRVHAEVRHTPVQVHLIVEDDGPGIPAELRDKVFERFVRGAGDRGGSVGLGLSIVRAVADSHSGEVVLQSPTSNGDGPPRGTRFVVTLPAAAVQATAGEKRRQPATRATPPSPGPASRR